MKNTFKAKSFASKTFASGNWTGEGVDAVIIPAGKVDTYVRRVSKPDQTPLRRVEVPTGTVRRV